jgi:hypothetical protein
MTEWDGDFLTSPAFPELVEGIPSRRADALRPVIQRADKGGLGAPVAEVSERHGRLRANPVV